MEQQKLKRVGVVTQSARACSYYIQLVLSMDIKSSVDLLAVQIGLLHFWLRRVSWSKTRPPCFPR